MRQLLLLKLRPKQRQPLKPRLKPKKKPDVRRKPSVLRRNAELKRRNANKLKKKIDSISWPWSNKESLRNKPCKSSLKWNVR